ncbi:MAG: AhpC/TSA family protein [Bacteroidota bacterium]
MKLFIAITWLVLLFSGISFLFWQNEFKYTLPTPVPKRYQSVTTGSFINVSDKIKSQKGKPLFVHFFNPACPCSRFNVPHVSSLIKKYGRSISFAVVVLASNEDYTEEEIQDKFDAKIPVSFDSTIAVACGVYSTPQAVLIDTDHKLYYRGNYNKSRYCTDKNSNYAQMAIDSLINKTAKPIFAKAALKSYGCELPVCTK